MRSLLFGIVTLLLVVISCTKENESSLVGSWQMMNMPFGDNGQTVGINFLDDGSFISLIGKDTAMVAQYKSEVVKGKNRFTLMSEEDEKGEVYFVISNDTLYTTEDEEIDFSSKKGPEIQIFVRQKLID